MNKQKYPIGFIVTVPKKIAETGFIKIVGYDPAGGNPFVTRLTREHYHARMYDPSKLGDDLWADGCLGSWFQVFPEEIDKWLKEKTTS
jgi:hypothetical protein